MLLRTTFFSLVCFLSTRFCLAHDDLQDPTRPADYVPPNTKVATTTVNDLILTSVMRSPLRQVAIINGQCLQVGESIGEYKVVQIVPDGVKIQSSSKVFMLELNALQVKTAK